MYLVFGIKKNLQICSTTFDFQHTTLPLQCCPVAFSSQNIK